MTIHATAENPRSNFEPLLIGEHFVIVPPGSTEPRSDRHQIKMARGAFGSGEHETTRNCIEILATLALPQPPRILDLGSGTAILSIAALKLFGGRSWCVDIEEAAVASARHNCGLNHVESVCHHCGPLETLTESGFDLILANIYGDILLAVADDLVKRAVPGAVLLLSGILWEYNFDVRKRYQQLGCTVIKNHLLEDFSTVLLRKA
ncbi:MAG: 50S ribosomal protein L11 methyltransferase [Pelovirga sp.]